MGLFGKKKDFWDEVDEVSMDESEDPVLETEEFEEEVDLEDDGRFHPTKSAPLKAIARFLMFAAAIVLVVSGFVVYTYFSNGGTMTSQPNYYHSSYFGEAYDANVKKVLDIIEDIEARGEISKDNLEQANQDLIRDYMMADSNFAFVVYDEDDREVIASGEDAVERIESSYYFMRMDSSEGAFSLNMGMDNSAFDKAAWEEKLMSWSEVYTIYASVDNELAVTNDVFYERYEAFENLSSMFDIAKIAAIVAVVIFVLMLIFSIVATGNVKGYSGIKLSLFDKVFTEIALILVIALGGGTLFGAYYMYTSEDGYGIYAAAGLLVLAYIFIIRGYFSMVRRIKAGTFISNMMIYRLFDSIGKLPVVPRVLLFIIVLVALNGALVFALFNLDAYEFMGIPVVYVIVPIIFVLESICFVSWIIRKGNTEYEEDDANEDEEDEEAAAQEEVEGVSGDTKIASDLESDLAQAAAIAAAQNMDVSGDWEHMDLGASVDQAIGDEPVIMSEEQTVNNAEQTVLLPKEEIESLLGTTSVVRDSATSFDFIQLNKDVRKLHRTALKENGVTVTLRAPEKPIVLEMNKEDMWKAISMIYDNLEQYTEVDSRVYAEMYTQNGKLIYIVKNAVKADAVEAAKAIAAKETELTGGLKIAKEIVEKNHGKFVVAMDGNIFKTGILLDMIQAQ